jgi:hypothetical protein
MKSANMLYVKENSVVVVLKGETKAKITFTQYIESIFGIGHLFLLLTPIDYRKSFIVAPIIIIRKNLLPVVNTYFLKFYNSTGFPFGRRMDHPKSGCKINTLFSHIFFRFLGHYQQKNQF